MSDSARTTIYKGECLHIYRDLGEFPNLEFTFRLTHESNARVIAPATPSLVDFFLANEAIQRDLQVLRKMVNFTAFESRVTRAKDEEIAKLSEQLRKAEQAFADQRNFSIENLAEALSEFQAVRDLCAAKDAEIDNLRNRLCAAQAEAENYRLKLGKKAEG